MPAELDRVAKTAPAHSHRASQSLGRSVDLISFLRKRRLLTLAHTHSLRRSSVLINNVNSPKTSLITFVRIFFLWCVFHIRVSRNFLTSGVILPIVVVIRPACHDTKSFIDTISGGILGQSSLQFIPVISVLKKKQTRLGQRFVLTVILSL